MCIECRNLDPPKASLSTPVQQRRQHVMAQTLPLQGTVHQKKPQLGGRTCVAGESGATGRAVLIQQDKAKGPVDSDPTVDVGKRLRDGKIERRVEPFHSAVMRDMRGKDPVAIRLLVGP